MFQFSITLNVILTTSEVPHKVAPVHKVDLIGEEEAEVVHLCRHFSGESIRLSLIFAGNIHRLCFHTTEPFVVECSVFARMHSGEEHLLRTGEHRLSHHLYHVVAVRFVGIFFLVTLHSLFFGISHSLRSVGFTIEERFCAVLFTVEISAERENIFRRVLIHWRVRHGADDNHRISGVANHQHQHAQQRSVERAFAHHVFSVAFPIKQCAK